MFDVELVTVSELSPQL